MDSDDLEDLFEDKRFHYNFVQLSPRKKEKPSGNETKTLSKSPKKKAKRKQKKEQIMVSFLRSLFLLCSNQWFLLL